LGGLPYDELGITGYGVAEAAECAAPYRGIDLPGATVSIQGFGAVGAFAAKFMKAKGSKVVAVSSVEGAIFDPQGLDVDRLLALRKKQGDKAVLKVGQGQKIALGKELELAVDILIPGAIGDVITEKNMKRVKAKMIVEGANFPTAEVAQRYFHQQGILVVPDFVANAGAVMGTGKAMDNRYSCNALDPREVFGAVKGKMWKNVAMVLDEAQKSKRLPREVALAVAKERVRKAMELRGRIPGPQRSRKKL
jgi:glutamate dehydrogenase (NAD(P)+)